MAAQKRNGVFDTAIGKALSVCEKRALLRLNGRDVTMPFDQMVEECAFTGRRDAPLILAHFAVDRMRTLLREIRETCFRRETPYALLDAGKNFEEEWIPLMAVSGMI